MSGALQILGAALILVPFAWSSLGSLPTVSGAYLWLNLLGSSVLAVLALLHRQWEFLLLEGCWAFVAAGSLPGTLPPNPAPAP